MPLSTRGFITSDVHPGIKWNRNMESDLLHYQVFRYIRRRMPNCGELGNPEDIVPLATTIDTFYIDNMQNINTVISECGDQIGYYVIAVDKSYYLSTPSSSVEFEVDGCPECWVVKNSQTNELKNLPTQYLLHQNFPNPFNPETIIKYDLPEDVFVSLRVYDILGKEVAILINDDESAGFKSVKLNASNLPSGVYIYKIIAGNYSMIQKMILMK